MTTQDTIPTPAEPTAAQQATMPAAAPAALRKFVYNGKVYEDPDPSLSVDEVRAYLADFYEELTNAEAEEKTLSDGTVEVTFRRRIGAKG